MKRPCLDCGEPCNDSRCDEHRANHQTMRRGSARARGYDRAWDVLSKRARAAQPFCSDAHLSACSGPLTTDHLPRAWERKAAGKALRLEDVDVVCEGHNIARGSSRPGSERAETHAGGPVEGSSGPWGKADPQLLHEGLCGDDQEKHAADAERSPRDGVPVVMNVPAESFQVGQTPGDSPTLGRAHGLNASSEHDQEARNEQHHVHRRTLS